jgi:hypothetical protein
VLKRRVKAFLMVLAAAAVLLLLFLVVERVRGQITLSRYKKALAAQGEKLAAAGLRSSISDADNAASAVYAAIERLTNGLIVPNDYPPCMKLTPSGSAIVGFRDSEWVEDKKTNSWEQVAADVQPNAAVLASLRTLLAGTAFDNRLDYSQGFRMKLPDLASPKYLTRWFGSSAQLALRDGRIADALGELEAQVRIARLLAEDRIAISELVRIAIAAIARGTTWEALQAEGWTDEQLARLQQAWEEQSFTASMARSLKGERIFSDISSEMMRASNVDAVAALFWQEDYSRQVQEHMFGEQVEEPSAWQSIAGFFKKQVYCRVWRFAWSHQDQRHGLETMQGLIEAARSVVTNKSATELQELIAQIEEDVHQRTFYDRLRFPNAESLAVTARFTSKALRAETDRSMTLCAIALKRYALRHGKFPKSLDALVPEFVSAAPVDWMDGKPLRYRLNADGSFLLYSVGENLTDDGGDSSPSPDHAGSRAAWFRKDYVWPTPATPEEVEAYRREAVKQ